MLDTLMSYVEYIIKFVGEDTFFNLAAAIVGFLWLKFQRTMEKSTKNNAMIKKAMEFLEAGVSKTYQEYVRARKAASADGKLTEEERREARQMAYTFARSYAAKEGISLVRTLGADMIPVLLEKTVGGLKREASGTAKMVPNTVTRQPVQPVVSPVVTSD